MGVTYTVFDKLGVGSFKGPLSVGFGTTKNSRIQDLNWKYGILQQTKGGSMPVSVTYYGVAGMETQVPVEELPNGNGSDRFSYFHQLIIARRFSSKLSVQVAPSISHYNVVGADMSNDMVAIALGARYKFSPQTSIIFNVDQPLTKMTTNNPYPNIAFGLEVATSSHAFQFFATCFDAIVPQKNNMYNQNDPYGKGLRIGFNITRLWNF
jgi:predicted porin